MVFVFEFFTVDLDGSRRLLETAKHRVKSKDLADAHGQSMMRNFLFDGKRASICVIKDQTGTMLGEMRAEARENA